MAGCAEDGGVIHSEESTTAMVVTACTGHKRARPEVAALLQLMLTRVEQQMAMSRVMFSHLDGLLAQAQSTENLIHAALHSLDDRRKKARREAFHGREPKVSLTHAPLRKPARQAGRPAVPLPPPRPSAPTATPATTPFLSPAADSASARGDVNNISIINPGVPAGVFPHARLHELLPQPQVPALQQQLHGQGQGQGGKLTSAVALQALLHQRLLSLAPPAASAAHPPAPLALAVAPVEAPAPLPGALAPPAAVVAPGCPSSASLGAARGGSAAAAASSFAGLSLTGTAAHPSAASPYQPEVTSRFCEGLEPSTADPGSSSLALESGTSGGFVDAGAPNSVPAAAAAGLPAAALYGVLYTRLPGAISMGSGGGDVSVGTSSLPSAAPPPPPSLPARGRGLSRGRRQGRPGTSSSPPATHSLPTAAPASSFSCITEAAVQMTRSDSAGPDPHTYSAATSAVAAAAFALEGCRSGSTSSLWLPTLPPPPPPALPTIAAWGPPAAAAAAAAAATTAAALVGAPECRGMAAASSATAAAGASAGSREEYATGEGEGGRVADLSRCSSVNTSCCCSSSRVSSSGADALPASRR